MKSDVFVNNDGVGVNPSGVLICQSQRRVIKRSTNRGLSTAASMDNTRWLLCLTGIPEISLLSVSLETSREHVGLWKCIQLQQINITLQQLH